MYAGHPAAAAAGGLVDPVEAPQGACLDSVGLHIERGLHVDILGVVWPEQPLCVRERAPRARDREPDRF